MAVTGPGYCEVCGRWVEEGAQHVHVEFPWVPATLFEEPVVPVKPSRELWS